MFKIAQLKIKAAGPDDDLAEGEFTAYASVFGNIDSYGDKVIKGAFTNTLTEWSKKDAVIPLLYGHDMSDPNNNIGHVIEASEDDHGLLVKGQIDLEGGNGPQVYRLIKGRRLSQMSFAYDVIEGAWIDSKDESFYELRELKLYEVSVVPIGANQETELLAVKAAAEHARNIAQAVKAGRVLSAANEATLRSAADQISEASKALGSVLSAVEGDDQEKASEPEPTKAEEPEGAKAEESTPSKPVDDLARQAHIYELTAQEGVRT